MLNPSQENRISLEQRMKLIRAQICFSLLTPTEVAELSALMVEKNYSSGAHIVTEGVALECIYLIASGHAEMQRNGAMPLAILYPGEAVGTNGMEIFLSAFPRNFSVVALSALNVLVLPLQELHGFFHRHPHLRADIAALADQMQRVSLIKQLLPFERLTRERVRFLATKIEERTVAEGQEIFKQGDSSDCCYLMRQGHVEIISTDEQGEHRNEVRTAGTLFGDATLIMQAPRASTVRTLAKTDWYVLSYEFLSELTETENNIARTFMTLIVDRVKPEKNTRVSIYPSVSLDGQHIVVLKNSDNGACLKLSDQGEFIWRQLNGEQGMQEITLAVADTFYFFAPDMVGALISKLALSHFIQPIEVPKPVISSKKPWWKNAIDRVRNMMEARVVMSNVDSVITKIYQYGARWFFTSIGQVMLMVLAACGLYTFLTVIPTIIVKFETTPYISLLFLLLIPFTLVSYLWHELGRALASKAFGYKIQYMGVGWDWIGPIVFVDTSDTWLSTRRPRIIVNLAGILVDLVGAGIAALLSYLIPNTYIQVFLWLFALFTYLNSFRMLSPMHELDGYNALMDVLNRPQLRKISIEWLMQGFMPALRNPRLFKQNLAEVFYWIMCIVFLGLVAGLTYLLQSIVFSVLGIVTTNHFVSYSLPFFVMLIVSLSMIEDLRSQ